jgi:hypothetical protein
MAEVTNEAKAFFKDLRQDVAWWSDHFDNLSVKENLSDLDLVHAKAIGAIELGINSSGLKKADLQAYFAYMFSGLIHSVLVDIDGGSASVDGGRKF